MASVQINSPNPRLVAVYEQLSQYYRRCLIVQLVSVAVLGVGVLLIAGLTLDYFFWLGRGARALLWLLAAGSILAGLLYLVQQIRLRHIGQRIAHSHAILRDADGQLLREEIVGDPHLVAIRIGAKDDECRMLCLPAEPANTLLSGREIDDKRRTTADTVAV